MVKLKILSCTTIIVHGGTLLKSVSTVGFFEKNKFLGKCLFSPWNVFCDQFLTSPTHLYLQCYDFHQKKTLINLFRISFLQPVKDHPCDKFGYVDKIMPLFFQKQLKKFKFEKIREHHAERDVFGFLITHFFLITLKKNMWFTFSRYLRKKELFRKCLVSSWNGWFD